MIFSARSALSPRFSASRRRWVAGKQATTTMCSNRDSARVSKSSGMSTTNQPPSRVNWAARWVQRSRIAGWRISSSCRRFSSSQKTSFRSFGRSGFPQESQASGPKTSNTARRTAASCVSNSCAQASASKYSAGNSRSSRLVNDDLPVAIPPVTPRTGTYFDINGSSLEMAPGSGAASVSMTSSFSSSNRTGSPSGFIRRAETKMTRLRLLC